MRHEIVEKNLGLMIVLGVTLRTAEYDATVKAWTIGILYPGIGVALLIGGLLARNATPLPPKTCAKRSVEQASSLSPSDSATSVR